MIILLEFFIPCDSNHKNEICMRRRVESCVAIWCLLHIFMPKESHKTTKISINENLTTGIRIVLAIKPERASCDLRKWKINKSRKKSVRFLWLAPNNIEMHTPDHPFSSLSPSSWLKIFLFLFYFFWCAVRVTWATQSKRFHSEKMHWDCVLCWYV